jgi:hypothetical protein
LAVFVRRIETRRSNLLAIVKFNLGSAMRLLRSLGLDTPQRARGYPTSGRSQRHDNLQTKRPSAKWTARFHSGM